MRHGKVIALPRYYRLSTAQAPTLCRFPRECNTALGLLHLLLSGRLALRVRLELLVAILARAILGGQPVRIALIGNELVGQRWNHAAISSKHNCNCSQSRFLSSKLSETLAAMNLRTTEACNPAFSAMALTASP